MGTVGADISAIEIVEKHGDGSVIDDFILTMPPGSLAETIISACTEVPDVRVLWLSRYPDQWNIESDIEVINRMSKNRSEAAIILAQDAPTVFRCEWAALVNRKNGAVHFSTAKAPDFTVEQIGALGELSQPARHEMGPDWMPDWGEVTVASAPVDEERTLLLGRQGGPAFLDSELFRLEHLASAAR
ncbi:amino acid-binding protein [Propionibacterium sp.]|uniref:amino acid-binding protein n=1 Tax=Propionibacterium sp. TaxID=1977903 RepID=UPI0039E9EDB9